MLSVRFGTLSQPKSRLEASGRLVFQLGSSNAYARDKSRAKDTEADVGIPIEFGPYLAAAALRQLSCQGLARRQTRMGVAFEDIERQPKTKKEQQNDDEIARRVTTLT